MAIYKNTQKTIVFALINTNGSANTTASPTCSISKNGGNFAACNGTATRLTLSAVDTHVFSLVLTDDEMNADVIAVLITATNCVPVVHIFFTEADWSATRAGYIDTLLSTITAITNKIGALAGSGNNTILGMFKALMKKNAATPSDLGEDSTFNPASESLEAIKDLGIYIDTTAIADGVIAQIGSNAVNIVNPLATNQDITIVTGDDYYDTENRAITWVQEGAWPDLTGATVVFDYGSESPIGCTVSAAGTPNQTVTLELTNAQTTAMGVCVRDYQVIATLNNTHVVTLVEGQLTLGKRV